MRTATNKKVTPKLVEQITQTNPFNRAPSAPSKPSRKASKPQKAPDPSKGEARKNKPLSKKDQIIALLSNASGVSLNELMEATNWQAHSIRGFMSGTIKKKFGGRFISLKQNGSHIYRIASQ